MKRLQLFIFLLFTASVSAFSQDQTAVDRWSAESFVALANEEQLNMFGVEYGTRLNYNILDRFGASISLGSVQSLWAKKRWEVKNVSRMLLSVNVFGDIIKSQKGSRLRLSAGGTYLRGDVAYASWYIDLNGDNGIEDFIPMEHKVLLYNRIGMNVRISYLFPIADRWLMGVNLQGYEDFGGYQINFWHISSLGCSVGYKF